MNSLTRKQHYISKSALRKFTNLKGEFYEVYLKSSKIQPYSSNPDNAMHERDIYEGKNLKINELENKFEKIETVIFPQLKTILAGIESTGLIDPETKLQIDKLLGYFLIFYYRSRALIEEYSSLEKSDKLPLLLEKVFNHRYIEALSHTIKNHYKFALIKSDHDFLISDQYISTATLSIKSNFTNYSNRQIGLRETMILIPLSSSYYVVYWHTDSCFDLIEGIVNILDERMVKKINKVIINNSYVKCVGQKKEILDERIINFNHGSPPQVFCEFGDSSRSIHIKKKEVFYHKIDEEAFPMILNSEGFRYLDLKRNQVCLCKRGKLENVKFKHCHMEVVYRIKTALQNIKNPHFNPQGAYNISGVYITEQPIADWYFPKGT